MDAAFPAPATLCAPGRPATQLRRRFVQTISYRHRDTVQTAESDASPSLRCRVAAAEAKPLTNCCAPTVTFPLLDSTPLAQLADPAERAHAYAGRSKSAATIRACAVGWRDYLSFCERAAPRPCPPRIRLWRPTWRTWHTAGAKAATIARRMGGHLSGPQGGRPASPTTSSLVSRTHAGIRRTIGTAQTGKAPALVDDLKRMLARLPATRVGLRDRALLLLGFAGAFRRSEDVSLDVADLDFSSAGLIVTLRRAKTDQEGRSRRLGIPYGSTDKTCPVRSVKAWLESARITSGPLFRSPDRLSACAEREAVG